MSYYMFQNGQPTVLFWHNIQANLPIIIVLNGPILYKNYYNFSGGGPPDPASIKIVLDTIIPCIHIIDSQMNIQTCSCSIYIYTIYICAVATLNVKTTLNVKLFYTKGRFLH